MSETAAEVLDGGDEGGNVGASLEVMRRDMPPETASVVAQSIAMVQAHFAIARANPRNGPEVHKRLVELCKDPDFALEVEFNKPVGKGIRGLTARFAEAAMAELANLQIDVETTHDDDIRRTLKVWITDFQNNTRRCQPVTVEKTVERDKSAGRRVFGTRKGWKDQLVYIVQASADEITNAQNNAVSKAARNLVLQLLPPELKVKCQETARTTKNAECRKNPSYFLKLLLRVAERHEIPERELLLFCDRKDWVGITPEELMVLRETLEAVQDRELRWDDAMQHRLGELASEKKARAAAADAAKQQGPAPAGAAPRQQAPAPAPSSGVTAARSVAAAPAAAPLPTATAPAQPPQSAPGGAQQARGPSAAVLGLVQDLAAVEAHLSPEQVETVYGSCGISTAVDLHELTPGKLLALLDAATAAAARAPATSGDGLDAVLGPSAPPADELVEERLEAPASGGLSGSAKDILDLSSLRTKNREVFSQAMAASGIDGRLSVAKMTDEQRRAVLKKASELLGRS